MVTLKNLVIEPIFIFSDYIKVFWAYLDEFSLKFDDFGVNV
jgi:hypothetical protein